MSDKTGAQRSALDTSSHLEATRWAVCVRGCMRYETHVTLSFNVSRYRERPHVLISMVARDSSNCELSHERPSISKLSCARSFNVSNVISLCSVNKQAATKAGIPPPANTGYTQWGNPALCPKGDSCEKSHTNNERWCVPLWFPLGLCYVGRHALALVTRMWFQFLGANHRLEHVSHS